MAAKYRQVRDEILSWIHSSRLLPGSRLPSEHEIAEQFSVSRQTVRQALGELVREGWLNRMQGKGTFVADPVAKPQEDNRIVGVITTYISDYIFPQIVQGIETRLRAEGYRLLLASTENDPVKERECLEMMLNQCPAALIVEPTRSGERSANLNYFLTMENREIPYLMINASYEEMDSPCLRMDDEQGGFLAAEHLIELGHRRIAGFFKTDDMQGVRRMRGFVAAHRKYGIPLQPSLIFTYTTEDKHIAPLEQTRQLIRQSEPERATGWVLYNDELAINLLQIVREAGLSVPDDLSMVGFDDSFLATATEVKLTTLSHPKHALGTAAADMILQMMNGASSWEEKIHTPELIQRDSTSAPTVVSS
ncbi:GntR family transcriptional regulator [Paenibacillus wulumuqiensis]|uniref:GntR family transcriptional regulator n=1 Tax=Paenibacillus wulumuqiensis TaxID=1567107 RepID=UPI0006192450|nr:GntR family transcriptional regulator [Paenibacillus wulumuqiensis]